MTSVRWVFQKHWHPEATLVARIRAALLILSGHETEICGRCGHAVNPVWHAPDSLWRRANGTGLDGGVLCVECFDRLARRQGIVLYWEPGLKWRN